jgi:NAD(P)-dependent dehydrogenase (short-subunit alcohol dehydrogenase family)
MSGADIAALFDLTGKVALITGGSRGLGLEIAKTYARAGADIVITSRKLEACEAAVKEIEGLGRRALAYAAHVGHWDEMPGLVEAAYEKFGKIDILVNNAGMSPLAPSLADISEELFDKVIGVNLKGPLRLSTLIGPRMVAAGGGAIINVSSTGALRPTPRTTPYSSAKAALNALTIALAHEYGPTVRVNVLSPGPFLTDVSKAWPDERKGKRDNAAGRVGQVEEIATSALYLASAASSFTTGALLRVDGGLP